MMEFLAPIITPRKTSSNFKAKQCAKQSKSLSPMPSPAVTSEPVLSPTVYALPIPSSQVFALPMPSPPVISEPVQSPQVFALPMSSPPVTSEPVQSPRESSSPLNTPPPTPTPPSTSSPSPTPSSSHLFSAKKRAKASNQNRKKGRYETGDQVDDAIINLVGQKSTPSLHDFSPDDLFFLSISRQSQKLSHAAKINLQSITFNALQAAFKEANTN